MAENQSPTSTAATTEPDDMLSYSQETDYTSANSSPNHHAVMAAESLEWYDSKTPQVDEHGFHYQQESPDLDLLQADFSYSQSLRDHATAMRKSIVVSDSLASVALQDHQGQEFSEKTTQLAMTNSPSFSALASILERKEAKFQKKPTDITPILEETAETGESPSYQPSPLSIEQKAATVVSEESPNLIQFDDDDVSTTIHSTNTTSTYPSNTNNTDSHQNTDIFKTPEVTQPQRFPHQEYTSMLGPVDVSPNPSSDKVEARADAEDIDNIKPLPLPKKSPLQSNQYKQRSASMPVVTAIPSPAPSPAPTPVPTPATAASSKTGKAKEQKEKTDKRRSFMNIFRSKRSVSTPSVPKKSNSFVIPSPSIQDSPKQSPFTMKGSKSFTLSKSSTAQTPTPDVKPAQRSASSTSLFSAFKRKSSSQTLEKPPAAEPIIDIKAIEQVVPEEEKTTVDDAFSLSSDGFNEDFNNLSFNETKKEAPSPPVSSIPPQPSQSQPLHNKRYSQLSEKRHSQLSQPESRRYSQISQGEAIFPKNLSAQEVEDIVSLERNRSLSCRSSHRHSYVDQNIPRKPSMESLSMSSIQMSPGGLQSGSSYSPERIRRDYLSGDNEDDDDEDDDELFNVEKFSQRLEFDDIIDNHLPQQNEDEFSSQFAEFADYIDFGGALDLDLGFDEASRSPLSQPALVNSPQVSSIRDEQESFGPSPKLNQSPLSSPFLQQEQYVPALQRPVSMSFRGLKAPALSAYHDTDSMESVDSFQIMNSSTGSSITSAKKCADRRVVFSSQITVYDAHAEDEYDRKPDIATCNQLTPQLAMKIRAELNQLKSEMEVHEDSKCYTYYF